MKLLYENVANSEHEFLYLTGLTVSEFNLLLEQFSSVWQDYITHNTLEGKVRERLVKKERKNAQLPSDADKLFFILYHLKNNCLQHTLAVTFGMRQPHACVWIQTLTPILQKALGNAGVLPERDPLKINEVLADVTEIIIDGVERPIQRSSDNEKQKKEYSGKKKGIVKTT